MFNWKSWIWPGLTTTTILTALTGWLLSGPVEQDLTARAGEALKAAQPWSTVSFNGRDATVSGVALNDEEKAAAAKATLDTYGVRIVSNVATLLAKADPFALSLVKDAAGVALKGNYTTEDSRLAIISAAEKAMPGIAVKDELVRAAGEPAGFANLAAFGASQLADLTSGEVSLSNMDYSIQGDPVDLPAYEKVLAASAQLPASGTLKAANLTIPPLGSSYEFSAAIDGNTLNLNGYAPSPELKSAIEADAKAAFPDKSINNLLKLAAGAPEKFTDFVKFGFGQLETLGNGSMSLSDSNYSIKGQAADAAALDALMKAAKEGLPEGAVLAAAELVAPEPTPPPAVPYVWSTTLSTDGVKVEGTAPSTDAASSALSLIAKRFVKAEVSNAQTVRDGAPEGFGDAQVNVLKSLSYLSQGKAVISDRTVTLEGIASSDSMSKLVVEKTKAGLPAGYDLVSKITVAEPVVAETVVTEAAKPYVWSATRAPDGVKLEGSVLSGPVGQTVLDAATASFPGLTVTNAQVPLNPSPAGFAAAQAAVLKGLAFLQEGTATITDKAIALKGSAASDEAKSGAIAAINGALPEGYALNVDALTIAASPMAEAPEPTPEPAAQPTPALASPYMWMAAWRASGVKLEGAVPSADAGVANVELAARRFVKAELSDAQTVQEGAPAGFADAQAASMKALSYLNEGRVIHSDQSVDISGVAASEAVKALVIKNATAALPKDYILTTDIAVAAVAEVQAVAEVKAVAEVVAPAATSTDCMVEIAALTSTGVIGFESNKSDLSQSSSTLIANIAKVLAGCPDMKVEIAGHTDSDGSTAYNWRLSNDRAYAVRKALKAAGISGGRLKAKGYGEEMPVAANDTDANKALNRRIEFRAVKQGE